MSCDTPPSLPQDGSGAGGRKSSSQNSNMMSFNVSVPHFTIVSEGGSKHCLFKLSVECRHSQAAVVERWETHRRYRDFYDLHLTLRSEVRGVVKSCDMHMYVYTVTMVYSIKCTALYMYEDLLLALLCITHTHHSTV